MTTEPVVSVDAGDVVELGELLEFVIGWLDRDGDRLAGSFAGFVGTDGYGIDELRQDLSWFAWLLGGDHEDLVVGDE